MNEILDHVDSTPESLDMGGASPHTDTLIRSAACGQGQIGLFKTTRQRAVRSLVTLPALETRSPSP